MIEAIRRALGLEPAVPAACRRHAPIGPDAVREKPFSAAGDLRAAQAARTAALLRREPVDTGPECCAVEVGLRRYAARAVERGRVVVAASRAYDDAVAVRPRR
jgi:hypothetical protein